MPGTVPSISYEINSTFILILQKRTLRPRQLVQFAIIISQQVVRQNLSPQSLAPESVLPITTTSQSTPV